MARPTRVLYVENDPALRGILMRLLSEWPEIEVVAAVGSAEEALAEPQAQRADVALLDLALGPESLTGTELGLVLRSANPNIGIVILSQHLIPDFVLSLPESQRMGWSFLEKRGDLDVESLVDVLRSTARGLNVVDPRVAATRATAQGSEVDRLSPRQREIMSLVATGMDATAVSAQLGLASTTVRQELSKAYGVLVPDPRPGTDLRTTAVLRYLRATRTTGLDPVA